MKGVGMFHDYLTDALKDAVRFANEVGQPMRVVAFDWQPFYEGEEAKVQYTATNAECTLQEMRDAHLHNARICRTVQPNEMTVQAIEDYQWGSV